MKPKFVTVYQAGGSDGDRRSWDMGFYRDQETAGKVSKDNWGTPRQRLQLM